MQERCRIQYASDLHLEFYDKQVFPHLLQPSARLLALAGDIGRPDHRLYSAFLEWAHDKWDHIFLVAGNHEFYNKKHFMKWEPNAPPQTMEQRLELCRIICSKWNNVHFMEKDQVYLPDYNTAILGTTLWTNIEEGNMPKALRTMNDYNFIAREDGTTPRRFWPSDSTRIHKESVQWLNARIHEWEEQQKHVVVLTHHMPSYALISEQYRDHPANFCFATNLNHMLRSPVRAWICGHSHQQKEIEFQRDDPPTSEGSTILAINAYGYNSREQFGYNRGKVLSFDCRPKEPHLLA